MNKMADNTPTPKNSTTDIVGDIVMGITILLFGIVIIFGGAILLLRPEKNYGSSCLALSFGAIILGLATISCGSEIIYYTLKPKKS